MKGRPFTWTAGLFVLLAAICTGPPAAALDCPSACVTTCSIDTNCTISLCWCNGTSTCYRMRGGCGGSNPFPDPSPGTPQLPDTPISVSASVASFEDDFAPLLEDFSGWNITIDSGVTDFDITNSWEDEDWYTVVTDVLTDNSLCWSTNSLAQTIDIEECP